MKIQDFAAFAKTGSQEKADPDTAAAADPKVQRTPEQLFTVFRTSSCHRTYIFCSYLYNANNGIFRPKLARTRKRQRGGKTRSEKQRNKKKRISDARSESPWCVSQVRIGDEFQLSNADIPQPCCTGAASELFIKGYVEQNQRFQHDDHGHSQSFNALRAKSNHVDVENFIKIAKKFLMFIMTKNFFSKHYINATIMKLMHYVELVSARVQEQDVDAECF